MKTIAKLLVLFTLVFVYNESTFAQKVFEFEDYHVMLKEAESHSTVKAGDLRGKDIEVKKMNRGISLKNQHEEKVRIKILDGKDVILDQWVDKGASYEVDCKALDYGHYNIVVIAKGGGIIKKLEIKKEKS
jgi:hypothetical protein